jgi:hypothetical protein
MLKEDENKVRKFFDSQNPQFLEDCKLVELVNPAIVLKPSKRQASKWLRQKGLAWKTRKGLI